MKLVVQRVSSANVFVNNKSVSKISCGLFILLGVEEGDLKENAKFLAEKVSSLRIMADKKGKMNLNVIDTKSSILVVSQFTLLSNTSKGNRPSFIKAAKPQKAKELYEYFVSLLKKKKIEVQTGSFGEYMEIDVKLDGPVTINLNTK